MQGYQLTFFTQQDRRHDNLSLAEWLIQETHKLGIAGATMIAATEGFGHDQKLHSARFFDLADQPIQIIMAISQEDVDRLFDKLREERINIFYIKAPIEFGMTGEA